MKIVFSTILVSVMIVISGCIEDYEGPSGVFKEEINVEAEISDIQQVHTIKISYAQPVGIQLFKGISGADVQVISDANQVFQFIESSDAGVYKHEGHFDNGKRFKLKITLPENIVVNSDYQNFPKSFDTDSISFNTDYVKIQQPNGSVYMDYLVSFFINSSKNKLDKPIFLRFDVETVFLVNEVICSPFITPKSCYVYDYKSDFDINLLELDSTESPFFFKQKVFDKVLDFEMGGAFSVKVDALSYNESNFQYWKQFKSLFDQSGSVTDLIPSRLRSNLTISAGTVTGIFSCVSKRSLTRIVRRGEVGGRAVEPFCGTPGFFEPWPTPSECCNCLLFPKSTTQKPDYW